MGQQIGGRNLGIAGGLGALTGAGAIAANEYFGG
jgi:hypothetical protein